ncbi:MAG: nicotinate phosphoribosyltransferase [Gammaproteobacteria bacterium]
MISPLLTDLYQLTMAYGYWKLGLHEREAVFHMIFRKLPFHGNYAVACGLGTVIEFLEQWRFTDEDLTYLSGLRAPNGSDLFAPEFLDYLKNLKFSCDIDAIPEGTVVFPHEPLIRVKGPLLQGQLLESILLNIINFQTLIATKAARVCQVTKGDTVLEFGMRRAQGPDGALSASRASYIGGVNATSNVLAGKLYDIPVSGTHAHSWVTAFPNEKAAFTAYASVMPHNCILLVDTYETLQGVKHAIEVGKKLREQGGELLGVRLDSGDMASLSIQARKLLDEAGFSRTKIIASNSLDEYAIQKLKQQKAPINVWGVGTNLVTAYDHPALDGVYKLSALRDTKGAWQYKLKLSEQAIKVSNPGIYQVRRFFAVNQQFMDVMYDVELGISKQPECMSLDAPHKDLRIENFDSVVDLLVPIYAKGRRVYATKSIHTIREEAIRNVDAFLQAQADNIYVIGLEKNLHELKQRLITEVSLNLP